MSDKESYIEMEDPRYPATPASSGSSEERVELNIINNGVNGRRDSTESKLPLRSYSKWSPTEQGATLVWRDLCVYTAGEHGSSPSLYNMKRIINNSNGAVQPGNLMALMGSRCVSVGDKCLKLFIVKYNMKRI